MRRAHVGAKGMTAAVVVRVVVAYPAGGANDFHARLIAQKLTDSFGQQFVVDNRAGAAGNIAFEYVAKAAPDGYTLLMGAGSMTVAPSLYSKLGFDVPVQGGSTLATQIEKYRHSPSGRTDDGLEKLSLD